MPPSEVRQIFLLKKIALDFKCIKDAKVHKKKPGNQVLLSNQDSNLDKQDQNLLCCHYTIGQTCAYDVQK